MSTNSVMPSQVTLDFGGAAGSESDEVRQLLIKVGEAHLRAIDAVKKQLHAESDGKLDIVKSSSLESVRSSGRQSSNRFSSQMLGAASFKVGGMGSSGSASEDSQGPAVADASVRSLSPKSSKVKFDDQQETVVDIDGKEAQEKVRFPTVYSTSSVETGAQTPRSTGTVFSQAGASASLNKNLQLRSQWAVHPEQENTDLFIVAAGQTSLGGANYTSEPHSTVSGIESRKSSKRKSNLCYRCRRVRKFSDLIAPPGANWRLCWDLTGAMLIGYDTVMIPFTLAFQPKENAWHFFMSWYTMLFWTVDMVLTFFVGYVYNGVTIMDPKRIAKKYLITWFGLDVVVIVGDWFTNVGEASSGSGGVGGLGKMVRSLRAIRVLRLLRLLKLRRMMADFQDHINSEYTYLLMSLLRLLFFILFLNHVIACIWFFVGRHEYEKGNSKCWVKKNSIMGRDLGYKYTTSLHWTLTQFTPASMEVFPQNSLERTISVVVLMFALVAFSSFVGSISSSMTALRNMNAETNKQFWMLRRYLKQQRIAKIVSRRIVKYLEFIVEKKQGKVQQGSINILNMLSGQLREELTFELTFPHLRTQCFIMYFITYPLMDVVVRKICATALKNYVIASGDHLFYPGDEASYVYCFLNGDMLYLVEDTTPIDPPIQEMEWIAEPAIWAAWKHVGRFRAQSESELISIEVAKFVGECCKTVASWNLASQYGEQYLEMIRGLPLCDIIRDGAIAQFTKELMQAEKGGNSIALRAFKESVVSIR